MSGVGKEVGVIARLAVPVAVTQVGFLTMGLVDTWMVGRLGSLELAAVALGDTLFFSLVVTAMGILIAVEPLVAQAHGAERPGDAALAHQTGRRLTVWIALPLVLLLLGLGPLLERWESLDPEVARLTNGYITANIWGVLPWLWFTVDRGLVHGVGTTLPPLVLVCFANVLNVALDWALIFGNGGAPALGVAGSGLASALSRTAMWIGLMVWLRVAGGYSAYREAPATEGPWRRLVQLGVPIGLTKGAEVGAFAAASVLMAWVGVVALAAHTIALKMASATFMLAMALGTATGVRVGHAVGARRLTDARRSAWVGVGMGGVLMVGCGLWFWWSGSQIVGWFSEDPAVQALGGALLGVAAVFQLSDGLQAVTAGALKGAGDTVWPFWTNLIAHWGIGLPLGYACVFWYGLGATWVWWGIATGLSVTAVVLLGRLWGLAALAEQE